MQSHLSTNRAGDVISGFHRIFKRRHGKYSNWNTKWEILSNADQGIEITSKSKLILRVEGRSSVQSGCQYQSSPLAILLISASQCEFNKVFLCIVPFGFQECLAFTIEAGERHCTFCKWIVRIGQRRVIWKYKQRGRHTVKVSAVGFERLACCVTWFITTA